MIAGFLPQNGAEWRAGGPELPDPLARRLGLLAPSDATRRAALVGISVIVTVICLGALVAGIGWIVAAIGAALIVNAIAQVVISVLRGAMQPGTLAGLLFMLPTALWAVLANGSHGWLSVVAGPVLSVPVLICVWWWAARLTDGPGR